ncbi:sensor histidine kinase [Pseudarthrobacter sp. P1]|uniref:sensor histidine kinase n=1 Tax=Pseudarthrobacter sp. P1 TaxID=3418418 RepID=UPI003CEA51B1
MKIIRAFARYWGAPAVAALFFVLWCVAEAGRMGGSFAHWLDAWALAAFTVALGISARFPVASMGIIGAFLGAQLLRLFPAMQAQSWPIYFAAAAVLFFVAFNARRKVALAGLILAPICAALMALVVFLRWRGFTAALPAGAPPIGDMVVRGVRYALVFAAAMVVCGLAGYVLRIAMERRELVGAREVAEEGLRATEIELLMEQERSRISRDLHDVLAHSLAVIVAQSDGARYLATDQAQPVVSALENISAAARLALVDAQRAIEGVRDDGAPAAQPALADVAGLLARFAEAGLVVEQTESGAPVELGGGAELAVFRIVQESLTNALKHSGPGARCTVHLDWNGPGLSVQIASCGGGRQEAAPAGTGRGIPGMRERAYLAGGWLTAGPDADSFRVTAFIPYGQAPLQAVPALALAGTSSVPSSALAVRGDD